MKRIGAVVAVLIVGLVVFIATRPAGFKVERSAEIAASPEAVYGLIADFRQWPLWSPWEKLDPGMKKTFSGSPTGEGAIYEWAGNEQAGQGRMTILSAVPGDHVEIKLEFLKPFQATNRADFLLVPDNGRTRVVWTMTGENGFLGKAVSTFMDMDKMVGKDFESGLSELKRVAEAVPKPAPAP